MTRDVGKYVEEYDLCQRMKNRIEEVAGKLKLSKIPEKLWTHLTVTNSCRKRCTSGGLKQAVQNNAPCGDNGRNIGRRAGKVVQGQHVEAVWVIRKYGVRQRTLVCSRTNQKVELNAGNRNKMSTMFHSQTDGQMEQINQELEQYLRFFIDHKQKNWPEWLALAEFAVNNKVHTATKMSPFMANYSRELRIEGDIRKKGKVESVAEFVERMKKVYEEVGAVLKKT